LEKNHNREKEVWLVYFKPASGKSNIDYESSVEEALCFGWIDSIIQKMDENKYARKFNPRRMDSKWSETNKRRVIKILREGRITKAGMAKITFDVKGVEINKPKANRLWKCPRRSKKHLSLNLKCGRLFRKLIHP
jgi:uncharacterized protein YdeI (YjbR/CyaY-like superfamily)